MWRSVFALTVLLCLANVQGRPVDLKDHSTRPLSQQGGNLMTRRSLKRDWSRDYIYNNDRERDYYRDTSTQDTQDGPAPLENYEPCDQQGCCYDPSNEGLRCWAIATWEEAAKHVCVTDGTASVYAEWQYLTSPVTTCLNIPGQPSSIDQQPRCLPQNCCDDQDNKGLTCWSVQDRNGEAAALVCITDMLGGWYRDAMYIANPTEPCPIPAASPHIFRPPPPAPPMLAPPPPTGIDYETPCDAEGCCPGDDSLCWNVQGKGLQGSHMVNRVEVKGRNLCLNRDSTYKQQGYELVQIVSCPAWYGPKREHPCGGANRDCCYFDIEWIYTWGYAYCWSVHGKNLCLTDDEVVGYSRQGVQVDMVHCSDGQDAEQSGRDQVTQAPHFLDTRDRTDGRGERDYMGK